MALSVVPSSSTEIEHLASVDVQFSGAHLGAGIYFSANHFPSPGGSSTAIPQRSLDGEAASNPTTELDFTLPAGGAPWLAYRDDTNGSGTITTADAVKVGFDIALHVGDPLAMPPSPTPFYDGPAAPLLIANDPNELSGDLVITGYPNAANSLTGTGGVLHQETGTLPTGAYVEETVGSDVGGYFVIFGSQVFAGMSGGGNFLEYDADGDGTAETYLIGASSRSGEITDPMTGAVIDTVVLSTAFAPHYAALATEIAALTGADARTADDFNVRHTLLSAQTLGSTLTTVQGQFFHENIFGGINADTLLGAGGDDLIEGREGADSIDGGDGDDTLNGGAGNDTLAGGAGADWFSGEGFGGGAADVIDGFEDSENDVIDMSSFFATLDDVLAASSEPGDGSVLITLPGGAGTVQVLDTSLSDLRATNLNVICFTTGTHILTPTGEIPIECLSSGDPVCTYDRSVAVLRAITFRQLGSTELRDRPNLWPVMIAPDALGQGVPARPLCVSPQHRILVNSKIARRMEGNETLLPAKSLLSMQNITQTPPGRGITYVHLVFDRHEIIRADGCWCESFFPGDMAMQSVRRDLAREYRLIFGSAARPARPLVKGRRAKRMIGRHVKNDKPVQTALGPMMSETGRPHMQAAADS